ncbi:DUF58 domain-containing protein [Nitratiruptor sp. YY09-18]|uniref:DUF58 domain-containing protein n=1 Tax=Nitratiruptor sp. YY09-18 TaxID=2724901 RepID=UPI001915FC9F|nr:DUF58 domain-containing protein [Nitratiruptor sp. YY09-18]BCD68894.1 hypothetical protein NitYY0918_C1813 [Nitratiruptor sp. YY09-18]
MIDALIIKTKKEVFSKSSGLFSARSGGEGYDFLELREYNYGEDAKRIDWIASAKYQKPYIRIYQEELLRNIVGVFVLSGSLYFGSKRLKIETLLEAFLLVGYSALHLNENLQGFAHNHRFITNIYTLEQFAKEISSYDLLGKKATFDEKDLFYRLPERSLILLFGDFLDPTQLTLLAQKHEVVAIVARDSIEKGKDLGQSVEAVDTITLQSKNYFLGKSQLRKYGENIQKHLDNNYAHFVQNGIDWVEIYDIDNIYEKLQNFFIGR